VQAQSAPTQQKPTPTAVPGGGSQADALRREGINRFLQGDAPGALAALEQALRLAREAGNRVGEGAALVYLGQAYESLDQYPRALDAYQQVLALARALGERPTEGAMLHESGRMLERLARYEEALDAQQQALAIAQALGDRAAEGAAARGVGQAAALLGQYARALAAYDQALASVRQAAAAARAAGNRDAAETQRAAEFTTLNNVGRVYDDRGQPARALATYQQALAIIRELIAGTTDPTDLRSYRLGEGRTLNNVGAVYASLGDPLAALERYQQALAVAQAVGDRRGEMTSLANVASAYNEMGDYTGAVPLYQQALEIARQTGDRPGERAALDNLGVALDNLDDVAGARDAYERSLAVAREIGDRPGEQIALTNLGALALSRDRPDDALPPLEQALAIGRDLGDRKGEAAVLSNLGYAARLRGDPRAALAYYEQAIAASEDVRAAARIDALRTSVAAQASARYEPAVLVLHDLGRDAEAFALAERARARTFLDQLGNTGLDLGHGDPALTQQEQALRAEIGALDRRLREARAQPAAQQDRAALAALDGHLATRQRDYETLVTQLKVADPETASLVSVAPLGLPEVQALLDADTTLVSYFVTPDQSLAFVLTRDRFEAVPLAVKEPALRAAIDRLRAFRDPADAVPALQQLGDWLVAPLAPRLTTPVVAVVPHGPLHYLPFAALPLGDGLLGDAHALHTLPSASVLSFIQAKRKPGPDRVLALAQSEVAGLPPLRFADAEAATIARLYGATALEGPAATETALRAQAGNASIVHLAAHGELNERRSLFSRIFLGPDGENDGSLTVQDVYGLNLASADLVVLSACETQLGARSRGDDFVGLTRAFIYAGAPSVIASLWSVNDQATAVLMAAFYRHLRAGASKAAALQAAQAETRAQYPHPYYWAAFVLTGDPGAPAVAPYVGYSYGATRADYVIGDTS
jgi:CHAT domain-containing protein